MEDTRKQLSRQSQPTGGFQNQERNPQALPTELPHASVKAGDFCDQIRSDASDQADSILKRARHSADRKIRDARTEAQQAAQQLLTEAHAEAALIDRRTLAGVSLDSKRILLKAHGRILDDALEELKARVDQLRSHDAYNDFLVNLAAQAVIALDEKHCIIAPGRQDIQRFTDDILAKVSDRVEKSTGSHVTIALSAERSPDGSGLIAYSTDGNALLDNTVSARFRRLEDELKVIISHEAFALEEEPSSH